RSASMVDCSEQCGRKILTISPIALAAACVHAMSLASAGRRHRDANAVGIVLRRPTKLFARLAPGVVSSRLFHAAEDRTMFPVAARLAGALALVALAIGFSRADEADPVYEGMKVSKWIDTVQNDSSARKRALAVDALGKIWVVHKHKDALPNIARSLRVDPSAAVRAQAAITLAGLRPDAIT